MRISHNLLVFTILLLPVLLCSIFAAEYKGYVGKLDAVFSLQFHSDGSVSGTYSYPRRPGVVYKLRGENREEGKLILNEFTKGTLSAHCKLTKELTDSTIVWKGTMTNVDGRGPFEMSFSRSRSHSGGPSEKTTSSSEIPVSVPDRWPFSPTEMNAHIFGKVYFGSFGGFPAWGAMVFNGEDVELQFSGSKTGWKKRILNGTNPEKGVLRLIEGRDSRWEFHKQLLPNRLEWRGIDPASGEELLLSRRRENDWLNDTYKVTPESCRWMYTRDPDQSVFYQEKIGRFELITNEVFVKAIEIENQQATRVVLAVTGKNDQSFEFEPPRPLNRIPVTEGMVLNAKIDPAGRIKMTFSQLGPQAYRIDSQGIWELLMSPIPEETGKREAPRIVIAPDFFDVSSPSPFVGWWIDEDIIEWNEEAAGPGALELESINLQSVTLKNEDTRKNGYSPASQKVKQRWHKFPEWNWFYDEHLDKGGPQRTIPLQMRIWTAG